MPVPAATINSPDLYNPLSAPTSIHAFRARACVCVCFLVLLFPLFHAGLQHFVPCPPFLQPCHSLPVLAHGYKQMKRGVFHCWLIHTLACTRADAVSTEEAVSSAPPREAQHFDGFTYMTLPRSVMVFEVHNFGILFSAEPCILCMKSSGC